MTIHSMWKKARKESKHSIGYVDYIDLLDFVAHAIKKSAAGKEKKDER